MRITHLTLLPIPGELWAGQSERYACRELYRRGKLKDEARRIERELDLREVQLRD